MGREVSYLFFYVGSIRFPGGRAHRRGHRHGYRHQVPLPALLQGRPSRCGPLRRVSLGSGIVVCFR